MTQQKLVFRVDGNATIGMGHITRCISFAQMAGRDLHCTFCIGVGDTNAVNMVAATGFETIAVSAEKDLRIGDFLSDRFPTGQTIVVLDGYAFTTDFQQQIVAAGFRLVVIDDLVQETQADVVINTADGISPESYSAGEQTRIFTGHRYALLRQPFLERAGRQRTKAHFQGHLLVSLGATDPLNLTSVLLPKLGLFETVTQITVLAGADNPNIDQLKQLSGQLPQDIRFVANAGAEDVAQLIETADLAIVSASNIANECIATGVPLACIQTADNQSLLYRSLVDNGLCFGLGTHTEVSDRLLHLKNRLSDPAFRENQLRAQRQWIDGKSPERIRHILDELYGITH